MVHAQNHPIQDVLPKTGSMNLWLGYVLDGDLPVVADDLYLKKKKFKKVVITVDLYAVVKNNSVIFIYSAQFALMNTV